MQYRLTQSPSPYGGEGLRRIEISTAINIQRIFTYRKAVAVALVETTMVRAKTTMARLRRRGDTMQRLYNRQATPGDRHTRSHGERDLGRFCATAEGAEVKDGGEEVEGTGNVAAVVKVVYGK